MQIHRKPLFDRLAVFPRVGLANLPTPLEPMKRLTTHLGGPRLWVKREDATGLGFGGNKLRKLDYVLHEALSSGADTIVSGGVVQSNSQRQVAAVAAKLGLACHLAVYHGRLEPPTPEYNTSGNAFLNRLFGAQLHDVPWTGDRNAAIRTLVGDLERKGHRPYFVPYGVSNALGGSRLCHDHFGDRTAGSAVGLRTSRYRALYRKRRHAGRSRCRCSRGNAKHADRWH
jgi:L-cysteate sulfo-lyase